MCSLPEASSIANKISTHVTNFTDKILYDGVVKQLDSEQIVKANELSLPFGRKKLNYIFEEFIRGNVGGFAPAHSTPRLYHAVYKFCEKHLKIDDYHEAQKIVMSDENNDIFQKLIGKSIDEYKNKIVSGTTVEIEDVDWSVPTVINYGEKYTKKDYKKSVMQPVFVENNALEIEFMDLMDRSNDVKWWFKNGVRDKKYFAVLYDNNGIDSAFYVDFIVKMNDGRIGLFDTKNNLTAIVAKHNALREYVKQNTNLFGGLVKKINNNWRYSDTDNFNDESRWPYVDLN